MTTTRPVFKQLDNPVRAETSLRESVMLRAVADDRIAIAPSKLKGPDVRPVR